MAKEKRGWFKKVAEPQAPETQTAPQTEQPSPPTEKELAGLQSPSPDVPQAKRDTITVDAQLFYRIFRTCVHGYGAQLNRNAGVSKFGAALGGKTPQECVALWHEAQKYLAEHP